MARKTKQQKPDPAKMYVCLEPHVLDFPLRAIKKGTRLRGSDPSVEQAFDFWVEDGTMDDNELNRERVKRFHTFPDQPEPPSPKPKPRVRAKRNMRFQGTLMADGSLSDKGMTYINEGDTVLTTHPAYKARPKDFEPVE